MLFYQLV